jgi:hypothetical protein
MHAETAGTPLERFRRHYFDRDHAEFLETVDPAFHGLDHTAYTVSARLTEPDADTFIDQVLRMDATMLITDDPVKTGGQHDHGLGPGGPGAVPGPRTGGTGGAHAAGTQARPPAASTS